MLPVHFMPGGEIAACGIDRRTEGEMRWTQHKLATTCEACQNTATFTTARQVIPRVQGGPYRHGV